MAVKIRLKRMGNSKRPFFRITVGDSRRTPKGRFIESIGWYDPLKDQGDLHLDVERLDDWTGNGAQMSDTVSSLVKRYRKAGGASAPAPKTTETATETAVEAPPAEETPTAAADSTETEAAASVE